jgi:hypothetical protein
LEAGTFYKSFGLGVIYNTYAADATTSYDNADVNSDMHLENGVLNDNMKLRYTGLELLYKRPLFSPRFDISWKIALGMQSYTLDNYTEIMGTYPYSYSRKITGNIFTTLLGIETDYKELKMKGTEYQSTDNVSRFNAGLKITVTL